MRTIIDLPEPQIEVLDRYRKSRKISRAEAIRRAVAAFLPTGDEDTPNFHNHPAFGSSRDFCKEDPQKLVRRLRDEWE